MIAEADLAVMWDYTNINSGFIVIRPTANGRQVWNLTEELTSVEKRINDQVAFNQAIE